MNLKDVLEFRRIQNKKGFVKIVMRLSDEDAVSIACDLTKSSMRQFVSTPDIEFYIERYGEAGDRYWLGEIYPLTIFGVEIILDQPFYINKACYY